MTRLMWVLPLVLSLFLVGCAESVGHWSPDIVHLTHQWVEEHYHAPATYDYWDGPFRAPSGDWSWNVDLDGETYFFWCDWDTLYTWRVWP